MTTQKPEFAFRQVTDVTLTKVTLHKVFHGPDPVQAVDLVMAIDLPNTMLDNIVPGLREALYWNQDAAAGQEEIEGVESTLPNLKFPRLNGGRFALDDKKNKLAGFKLFIDYGLGDERSNMVFDCCKVAKRVIETKEGGTIHLSWHVQYNGDRLDQETCGKLALLEQDLIAIRLIPPVVAEQETDSTGPENPFGDDDDEAAEPPMTAEDLFINGAAEPTDEGAEAAALESDAR